MSAWCHLVASCGLARALLGILVRLNLLEVRLFMIDRPLLRIVFSIILLVDAIFLFITSRFVDLNSDSVQNYLEVSSIIRGNVLLHGWLLASDNFYLSDNIPVLLGRLVFGHVSSLPHIMAFVIYFSFICLAIVIIRRQFSAVGRSFYVACGLLLFYLGTPGLRHLGGAVMLGAYHIAELTFCLVSWVVLDAMHRTTSTKFRILFYSIYIVSTFIVFMSDPLGAAIYLIPTAIGLLIFYFYDYDIKEFGYLCLTFGIFIIAHLALHLVHAAGGFRIGASYADDFVSAPLFFLNLEGVFFGLLHLSSADFFGRSFDQVTGLMALVRLLGVGVLAGTAVIGLTRGLGVPARWNLGFVLSMAVCVDIGGCIVSGAFTTGLVPHVFNGGESIRYLTPAILFGGILVSLELPVVLERISNTGLRAMSFGLCALAVFAAFGVYVGRGVERWREPPAIERSAAAVAGQWLARRGLTQGVGTYFSAALITVISNERVTVRAVIAEDGHLVFYPWLADAAWARETRAPQFVIYNEKNVFGITKQTIEAGYHATAVVAHVAGYDVAVLQYHEGAGVK